jgi:hypothetical protein
MTNRFELRSVIEASVQRRAYWRGREPMMAFSWLKVVWSRCLCWVLFRTAIVINSVCVVLALSCANNGQPRRVFGVGEDYLSTKFKDVPNRKCIIIGYYAYSIIGRLGGGASDVNRPLTACDSYSLIRTYNKFMLLHLRDIKNFPPNSIDDRVNSFGTPSVLYLHGIYEAVLFPESHVLGSNIVNVHKSSFVFLDCTVGLFECHPLEEHYDEGEKSTYNHEERQYRDSNRCVSNFIICFFCIAIACVRIGYNIRAESIHVAS